MAAAPVSGSPSVDRKMSSEGSSADSLKSLNSELREHLTRLRSQLELQRGSIKQGHWQKVLDARAIRDQEQQKTAAALNEMRIRFEKEKAHELALLRDSLVQKYEGELQKLARHKEADITKLRIDLESKESVIRRLISESRRSSLRSSFDGHKTRLIHELSELRASKKELEDLLEAAHSAERLHSDELRKQEENFQAEIARVRREAQSEIRQLIEQLKSKDRVISQLERELGHPAAVAGPVTMATEVTRTFSSGQPSNKMETPTHSPHDILSGLSKVYQRLQGTSIASFSDGGEEKGVLEGFAGLEAEIRGLHDRAQALALDRQTLLDKVRDFETKNKQLVEKNKRFLEKNIELTALNRSLKDSSQLLQQQHKKMQEEANEARQRLCSLARELQREKGHSLELEEQVQCIEELKKQLAEQDSSITALRQACSEKDRRIELIQHRKKRRRLIRSQEKVSGVKETFYGYDDDDNDNSVHSVDSENSLSLSSVSVSTLSEEDGCDELSREELERSHRQMLREHLQLERSHALLQAHTGASQDPHREIQTRSQLQADLFSAQCRIELLEKEIRSLQKSGRRGSMSRDSGSYSDADVKTLLKEREDLKASRQNLAQKLEQTDAECARLRQELRTAIERAEDLEFRILELEEGKNGDDHFRPDDNDGRCSPEEGWFEAEDGGWSAEDHQPTASDGGEEEGGKEEAGDGEKEEEGGETETQDKREEVAECYKEAEECQSPQSLIAHPGPSVEVSPLEGSLAMDTERLQRELKAALNLKSRDTGTILKRIEELKNAEEKVVALERMSQELQSKVIGLQQERDHLQEQLMRGAPVSVVAEVERRQNLELKEEISRFTQAGEDLRTQNSQLEAQLAESEKQCVALKEQLNTGLKAGDGKDGTEFMSVESGKRGDLTDEEKMIQNGKMVAVREDKSTQTHTEKVNKHGKPLSRQDSDGKTKNRKELEKLREKVESLEQQLQLLSEENADLTEKLANKSNDSSDDDEDTLHRVPEKPREKIKSLERQLQVLHSENMQLADRLTGHSPVSRKDRAEVVQRVIELEDFSSDLQDRIRAAEAQERQTREKLRLAEQTINELETSEAQYRDQCEELIRLERETKKQLQVLQATGRELREIILDKDVVEQALREKVEFLEKVEAQSSQRISELEKTEKSLREQLQAREEEGESGSDNRSRAVQEKLAALEKENRSLNDRISELEENEAIMRENWVRVADEDANRIQTLEEKTKMLELMNRDLKNKLSEAQDFVVINSGPAQGSLADELSASRASLRSSRPLSPGASDDSGDDEPSKSVSQLKRQLSLLEEEKNGKIASLQEKVAQLHENEIKLSETLAEMEMTERELRAKLALYESSEVTVEKMLKYQDKIKELRSSQESLLDQLETMESHELTLQERMEEMERRLKGKIVTLEVEMKGLKQKELKGAARIRELEKQETELTEKITKQEQKENSLYVRISSLMDQIKDYKTRVSAMETELEEKEKRCARVASLESKLHQIEEAYREKMVSLENKLTEREEQLAAEQEAHEEERKSLSDKVKSSEEALQSKEKEHNQRVYILEEMFAQKEKGLSEKISTLEKDLSEKDNSISSLENQAADRERHVAGLEREVAEKDSVISRLEKELTQKDGQITDLESQLSEKDSRLSDQLDQLQNELAAKERHTAEMEERLIEMSASTSQLQTELSENESLISDLKNKILDHEQERAQLVSQQQAEMESKEKLFEERLAFMENELEVVKRELSQYQQTNAAQTSEITSLKSALDEKEVALQSLQETIDRTEAEKKATAVKLGEKDTAFEARLREREEEFESEMHLKDLELKETVSAVETECESLRGELTEKDFVIEKLESTKNELLSKLEVHKDREQELSQKVTALETKLQELAYQKESEVKEATAFLQSSLLEAESEKQTVQQKLSSLEKQLLDSSHNIEDQTACISQLESRLGESQQEADSLRHRLSELEDQERESSRRAEALLQQEVMLKSRVSEVESQLLDSSRHQDQHTASIAVLSQQKSDLEASLSQVENDLSASQREIAHLRQSVSELTAERESVQKEVSDLKAECDRYQSLELRLREKLDKERDHSRQLEEQIGLLKEEKQSALDRVTDLNGEVKQLQQTISTLESQISSLEQNEQELKSQLASEQQSKSELERQFSEVSEDVNVKMNKIRELESVVEESQTQASVKSSRIAELEQSKADLLSKVGLFERNVSEKSDEFEKEKSELLSQREADRQAALKISEKGRELEVLLATSREKEKSLQDKVASLEAHVSKQQEDHSQMCQKLHYLEKREKELLEQITDVEQTVIIPLESENSELKEEVKSIKQQNDALNLQLDKQEERGRDDSEEIDGLRKSLNEVQLNHIELKHKFDILSDEVNKLELENATLKEELIDAETANKSLEEQLENNRAELKEREACDREVQTNGDLVAVESQMQMLQSKLTVLEDAESKFMSRIMDLEEREQELTAQLEFARQQVQEREQCDKDTLTDDLEMVPSSHQPVQQTANRSEVCDAAVSTDDLQEQPVTNVSELFARVQELETANQRLSVSLEQATAGELDRRQLAEKVQLLEQSEDKLMERVMELEESEVALRTQIDRSRKRAEIADELEEEISVLLQQEDEWKEKVAALSAENSVLSDRILALESQLTDEQSKSKSLGEKMEADQQFLIQVQKELKATQETLAETRTEYEENKEQVENQMSMKSQRESELQKEIQVLREDMNDVCERYKELEQENSLLKQQHTKVLSDLKEAETRCLELAGGVTETMQAVKSQSQVCTLPQGSSLSRSPVSSPDEQSPQVCSQVSMQMVQSSQDTGAQSVNPDQHATSKELLARISQLESELSSLRSKNSGAQNVVSSSIVQSPVVPTQSVRILSLHDALKENSVLRAQLHELQTRLSSKTSDAASAQGISSREDKSVEVLKASPFETSADTQNSELQGEQESKISELQTEVSKLQGKIGELEKELVSARETMQDVRQVVKTRSVYTLQQKIQMIQRTIRTQQKGPASDLNQQLLELLTSQAELQEEVVRLTESEQSLRSSLKTAEEELHKAKSSSASTTVPSVSARRLETERRLSVQSSGGSSAFSSHDDNRLRLGGPTLSLKERSSDSSSRSGNEGSKEREEWLERQISDLQFSKSSLERRLHEAERRLAFRPRSTNASRDELQFRIEQLQGEQTELKKKIEDLEALNSHYLKEKVELAEEKEALEKKLKESSTPARQELSSAFLREEPVGSSGTASEGESDTMLEKPEDILHNRIRELEQLEKHLRQQLNEVESDRDQLHEIARKDKAMIHEQNVRLRELMLQERNLRAQVSGLEDSERQLYNRCGELEDTVARLEDRVHELEVHERRLRELVRKLKLDEEVWLNKSGDLTSSMEQLSASEGTLRKMVQDLQIEKGTLADKTEYLEARVKELENLEATMMQRLKNYENVEASLQSRLQHMENSEAAAYSKASELDVINMDLSARLQRAVEENAVLSQHVAQQQGQIHELDRKLSTAMDAEVSLTQHVESLQKNESSLQKKVREYELRDIDAQARIRELEQTEEILKDKINKLQRSENRLKSRLVEFESVGSQVIETLPPAQKQQLPQKLEDCQKRIVVLQRQLEAAQAQLQRPQASENDASAVKVPAAVYNEMRTKVALLEETEYQLEEIEKLNRQLNDTIVQLRQGKDSCGHEVELEVLRRRINSYQNFNQKLKQHLSEGQVPSLWAAGPDFGQGPESEDLPARSLQSLESERVLHTVRGLTQPHQPPHAQEHIIQAESSSQLSRRPQGVAVLPGGPEEGHWRTIELRSRSQHSPAEQRGASARATVSLSQASAPQAHVAQEEMVIGLSLPSESERSFKSQNDTDSELSGAPHGLRVAGVTQQRSTAMASGVTKPPPMSQTSPTASPRQHASGFVTDDSFYLPSSAQEGSDSLDEDEAPPLPASAPPGATSAPPTSSVSPAAASRTFVSKVTMPGVGQTQKSVSTGATHSQAQLGGAGGGAKDSTQKVKLRTTSPVGISIRQRIAQIERQLQELPGAKPSGRADDEDSVFSWKAKATESSRLLGIAEREGKQLKEDLPPAARRKEKINRLEKDIEEKRRYFGIFEKWIVDAEEILKNKNKKNDRDIVQQLQTEMKHLKQDLGNAGYRKDDIYSDPAALKTELDRRDRELNAKRAEVESLEEELQRWRSECSNIEVMRRNALDALHCLEMEVTQLQDADIQLKQMKDEYNTLRGQYEEMKKRCKDYNQKLSDRDELEFTLKRTILERDHLKCDIAKVTEERDELESNLHEQRNRVRELSSVEEENTSLEGQIDSLSSTLRERMEKMREVYEENLLLHDRVAELQLRLERMMETRRDLENMCARYDELDVQRNKSVMAVHSLRAKVVRLAKKCQEKDELLRRLAEEARGGRGRSSSLLEELTRLEAQAAGEEYNRPLSPLDLLTGPVLSDTDRLLAERIPQSSFTRWPSSSSLGDPRDYASDSEFLRPNQQRPLLQRPRSADENSQRRGHTPVSASLSAPAASVAGLMCVAILDYSPDTASRSGHPRLELALKEGDQVRVRGPVNRHGYCEAEVGGRIGLVPASHLYPLTDGAASYRSSRVPQPHSRLKGVGGDSPEQIVQMFDELQDPRILPASSTSPSAHNHSQQMAHSSGTQTHQPARPRRSVPKKSLPPDAPTDLRVEDVEGNSIVLAWQPPALDQHGCSNGSKVVGYRIYLNGRVCQQPHSPRLSHTKVEGVRHDKPQHLAIQTLAASGQVSARVELVYQGVTSLQNHQGGDGEADTDLSSILNSIHYKTGKKSTVMGLYDYDPETQSPGDYPACELAFHAGDIMFVYGEERSDGFYHGERNGQRGLIPACFVEPVQPGAKPSQKTSTANGQTSLKS